MDPEPATVPGKRDPFLYSSSRRMHAQPWGRGFVHGREREVLVLGVLNSAS